MSVSLSKNLNRGKIYIRKVSIRHVGSEGSNTVDSQKVQVKNIVLSQWKLITLLKKYLSKLSSNSAVEETLNKEFAHFLQKIQPNIYGTDLWKYFNSFALSTQRQDEKSCTNTKQAATTFTPAVLNEFKLKKNTGAVIPRWKFNEVAISNESVVSRTRDILMSINNAKSNNSKITRIEDLSAHINKYPQAKHIADKDKGIGLLLRIKQKNKNKEVAAALNEALVLLGHVNPVSGRGIKILSIDGGGVRGILVIEMLKKLEELTQKKIHEMFDLICGVSTGAIIASLIVAKQHSLDEIADVYKKLSTQIFTQSAIKGTSNLVWSHSYYDTTLWEKLLREQLGDEKLINTSRNSKSPKFCALSAVVNQSRVLAYVFRNYSFPCRVQSQFIGGHVHCIWEAVRASAAAPTYFEEFKLGNKLHQDGGILFNNPTAVAIHEARLLWPETPLQCVVSFGTGRSTPAPVDLTAQQKLVNTSWKSKFYTIVESATDTEGVHTTLSDLLPTNVYYRFNPYLTEVLDIAEIDSKKLQQLERDVIMYLRKNEDKFLEASKTLKLNKTSAQKAIDWLNLQREMIGL